jgi:putative ABC transport system permease protein
MRIHPVLAALRKHRIATVLIALQIALACAVFCNACFLIAQRLHAMHIDSGLDEARLGVIAISGYDSERATDINARVLDALRHVSGVRDAGVVSAVPFGDTAIRAGAMLDESRQASAGVIDFYVGDRQASSAFGLRLVAGRMPSPDEYGVVGQFVPPNAPVLITRNRVSSDQKVWPTGSRPGQKCSASTRVISTGAFGGTN